MSKAVILGGTGLIGCAVARRLAGLGWQVEVCGRDSQRMPGNLAKAGATFRSLDRRDADSVASVVGEGADLLVDCLAFTASDAGIILPYLGGVGSTVMISSKAVYVDSEGRHVNSEQHPLFAGPIPESQPTMAPGNGNYQSREGYGANKVAAEQTLLDSRFPVTVIRASKVHGEGAAPAREWFFVKRVLDGRPAIFLKGRGEAVDHTTAAANLAALVEVAAAHPGSRILNSADPDAPTVLEISRAIAGHLGHAWEEVLLGTLEFGDEASDVGASPWDAAAPIVLDMTAAAKLGYTAVGSYSETVKAGVDWLVANTGGASQALQAQDFFDGRFDYAAEDRLLGGLASAGVDG